MILEQSIQVVVKSKRKQKCPVQGKELLLFPWWLLSLVLGIVPGTLPPLGDLEEKKLVGVG